MRTVAIIAAIMFTIAACGGGGGGGKPATPGSGSMTPPPDRSQRLPFPYTPSGHYVLAGHPAADDAKHMPVYRDNERLYVGVDQGDKWIDTFTVGNTIARVKHGLSGALAVVGERGEVEVRHGRLSDGVGRQVVSWYLDEASSGYNSVPRWRHVPEVRLVGTPNTRDRRLVICRRSACERRPSGERQAVGRSILRTAFRWHRH